MVQNNFLQNRESRFSIGKFKRGFTIIEFLIIFSMIGLLTTLSIASYNAFTESFKIKNEVLNAVAVLSLAQKRAIAGEDVSGDGSCLGKTFDSFIVSFAANAGYTMQGQCVDGVGAKTAYGTPVEYNIDPLNKNVAILDTLTVTFSKLTGVPDDVKVIRFENSSNKECVQIDIAATGLISSAAITCPSS